MVDISEIMRMSPVIPVLTVETVEVAAPLAAALVDAGLPVLELTLRTPVALDALSVMAQAAPAAVVGAGTVLDPDTLKRAVDAGARFVVSPGLTERLARAAEPKCFMRRRRLDRAPSAGPIRRLDGDHPASARCG